MVRTCPGRPEVRNWPSCVIMLRNSLSHSVGVSVGPTQTNTLTCIHRETGIGTPRVTVSVKRERERDYTYPALRLIQVLPGHPLADPKDEIVSSIQRRTSL